MQLRKRSILENVACIGLLVLVPVVFFLPFAQESWIPLDVQSVFFTPPWQEARPEGLQPQSNPYNALHAQRFYPWYKFIQDSVATERSLAWNPNEGFGAPFMALWRTRVFSPFTIPFYFFSLITALRWSVILKLVLAGWCAFYAARRFGLPPAIALFIAVTYQCSGPLLLWCGHPMSDALPWFPLLLPCTERLLLGQFRAWPLLSFTLALIALGGDPETSFASAVFVALYLVLRSARDRHWTHFNTAFIAFLLGGAMSLALIAFQLLPYVEYLRQGAPLPTSVQQHVYLRDLIAAFAPGCLAPDREQAAPLILLLYIGTTPLLLFSLWLSLRTYVGKVLRRRTEALFLAGFSMVLIALLFVPLLAKLPFLSGLRPYHFLISHAFAFTFLAAAAAEEWNELGPEQCKAALKKLFLYVPLLWVPLFGGVLVSMLRTDFAAAPLLKGLLPAVLSALVLLGVLAFTLLRPSARLTGYSLTALALLTLTLAFRPQLPRTPTASIFPETPFISSLKKMDTRIGGSQALQEWPLSGNGLAQVFSPSGVMLDRYQKFIERAAEAPLLLRRTGTQAFLLTKEDIQSDFAAVRPVLNIQQVFPAGAILFRDLEASPRARMIYAGRRVDHFDPAQLHPTAPPLLEDVILPEADNGPVTRAQVTEETNAHVVVEVEHTRPGVLVLADSWYPGWTATVDGNPAPIFPIDGVFRGVEVGEGPHTVIFSYTSTLQRVGLQISAATLLLLLISARSLLFRRKKHTW